MDLSGRTLGHYQIQDELSRGGMGVVYRATDTRLHREVALKVLPNDLMHDPERRRRFLQEAQAASALEHPHIAVIHAVEELDGHTFIAMELVRGEKMSDALARHRYPVARTLELAAEVAEGLARAHERGVVHRDLKPANVMVTDEGHAKIIDFGIAKLIERRGDQQETVEPSTAHDTEVGVVMGTMTYMSPEQARGDRVDHRSDIFSFGILLHEMLSGHPPFQGRTGVETASAILHDPAPRLPPLGPAVLPEASADIQRVVDKCLAKDPGDRYQGMKDLVVDLRSARRRLESTTHTAPVAAARAKAMPRWLWPAMGATVVAVALAVALIPRSSGSAAPGVGLGDPGKPSVAVLYFDNTTGSADLEWLRTGITEMVVTDLSQARDLEVVATDQLYAVMADLGRADDRLMSPDVIRAVAERTGVSNVIVGSYMKAGDAIRINVRLQDARTGRIVTSDRVEGRDESSLFTMVDELSRRLRGRFDQLRAEAGAAAGLLAPPGAAGDPDRSIGDVTTTSIEAFRMYAEGLQFKDRGLYAEATERFERAIALDPAFAMAHAKLAVVESNSGYVERAANRAATALEYAERLTLRERYYIEGFYHTRQPRSMAKAIEAYERCLEVDAGHQGCRNNLALAYARTGRHAEAATLLETAVDRSMGIAAAAVAYGNLADQYARLGQPERGLAVLDALLRDQPDNVVGHVSRGDALMTLSRFAEAATAYARAAELSPAVLATYGRIRAETMRQQWDMATAVAREMAAGDTAPSRWGGHFGLAQLHLYRGRGGEALRELGRATDAGGSETLAGYASQVATTIFHARADYRAGLAEAERAAGHLRGTPDEVSGVVTLAVSQAADGRPAEARKTLATVDAIADPALAAETRKLTLFAEGLIALEARETAIAVQRLEAATAALTPNDPLSVQVWYGLARAQLAAGRHADAARTFQQVVDAGALRADWPIEYVRSHYFLGTLHERAGDRTRARDAYRRFVEYWGDGDLDRQQVAHARQKIAGS